MTLLYLADTRFPIERANGIQTFETCLALARRGHLVRLVTREDTMRPPRDPFAFHGAASDPRLRIERLALGGPAWWRRAAFLIVAVELASRREADVVFTRDLGVATALLRWPRALRPPVIHESHGVAATVSAALPDLLSTARPASPAKLRRLERRERFAWRHAEGCVTITATLRDELVARFGPRDDVEVIPDGTRLPEAPPAWPPPAGEAPLVAYAGHLYPWKGVDVLVRALPLVPGVRALIIGGHPGEPDLARVRGLARSLGVADRVEFTGLVPPSDVAPRLARASVLVLPNLATHVSAAYTSPLKLFEYLAARRPIVASDLPAFREVLTDGVDALLVTPGDPAALAAGIRRACNDPALAARLADAAWARAADYSWDARARRIEDLAHRVLRRAGHAGS